MIVNPTPLADLSSSAGQLISPQVATEMKAAGFSAVSLRAVHWPNGPQTDVNFATSARNAHAAGLLVLAYMIPNARWDFNSQWASLKRAIGDAAVPVQGIIADLETITVGGDNPLTDQQLQWFCADADHFCPKPVMLYSTAGFIAQHFTAELWKDRAIIYARYPYRGRTPADPKQWAAYVASLPADRWPQPAAGWPAVQGFQFSDDWLAEEVMPSAHWPATDTNVVNALYLLSPGALTGLPLGKPDLAAIDGYFAAVSAKHVLVKASDHSDATKAVQWALDKVGSAGLVVDGQFGDATTAAVTRFQRFMGLAADGVVGDRTWAALRMAAHWG